MFDGKSKIEMAHTAIVKAVQEYLDKRIAPSAPRLIVKSVKFNSTYERFEVECTTEDPAPDAPTPDGEPR